MALIAEQIDNYSFKSTDNLFFDANIWFFLYGPNRPGDPRIKIYSGAFKSILSAHSRILTDILVVSEFINRYARLRHQLLLRQRSDVPRDFKQFRRTSFFKTIARDIAADTRKILGNCTRVESDFTTVDAESLIAGYEAGDSDFNDLMLVELCRARGFKLVTDDGDFSDKHITILTANKKLLKP